MLFAFYVSPYALFVRHIDMLTPYRNEQEVKVIAELGFLLLSFRHAGE